MPHTTSVTIYDAAIRAAEITELIGHLSLEPTTAVALVAAGMVMMRSISEDGMEQENEAELLAGAKMIAEAAHGSHVTTH